MIESCNRIILKKYSKDKISITNKINVFDKFKILVTILSAMMIRVKCIEWHVYPCQRDGVRKKIPNISQQYLYGGSLLRARFYFL